jgi:hypothetical protein
MREETSSTVKCAPLLQFENAVGRHLTARERKLLKKLRTKTREMVTLEDVRVLLREQAEVKSVTQEEDRQVFEESRSHAVRCSSIQIYAHASVRSPNVSNKSLSLAGRSCETRRR